MPRTDENGRQLKALLDYLFDGEVDAKAIQDALGTSSSTYYRRIKEADYPNAGELRLLADRFGLSYPELQVEFGLMSREEVWHYLRAAPGPLRGRPDGDSTGDSLRADTERPARTRMRDLRPRLDAPPL